MELSELIGREILVKQATGNQLRGWFSEQQTDGNLLVSIYGYSGQDAPSEYHNHRDENILVLPKNAHTLRGWRGLDLQTEAGDPWISLRFSDKEFAMVQGAATTDGRAFRDGLLELLRESVDAYMSDAPTGATNETQAVANGSRGDILSGIVGLVTLRWLRKRCQLGRGD